MPNPRLSACLIVRDESAHLPGCLESLRGIVDEIIVVDTGSTDDTVAIAERYGAVVGHFPWCDDFAAARNASLELATGDWVLWIDADERLTETVRGAVRAALKGDAEAYAIEIRSPVAEDVDESDAYVHAPIRLFRRLDGVRFEGRVHERVWPSLAAIGARRDRLDMVHLTHFGYTPSRVQERSKIERTIRLLELDLADHPEDGERWASLATARSLAADGAGAVEAARRAAALLPGGSARGPETYDTLCRALTAIGKATESLTACDEADRRGFGGVLNHFQRARALATLERWDDALREIDRCLALDWPAGLDGDRSVATYKRWVLKGQILLGAGRAAEAIAPLEKALAVRPQCTIATRALSDARARAGSSTEWEAAERAMADERYEEAEAIYRRGLAAHPESPDLNAGLAALLCLTQREKDAVELLPAAQGAPRYPALAQTLVDHLHCRALTAAKLGADDAPGRALLEKCRAMTGLEPSPHAGIRLSACLIVKNESKNLPRCLASLKGVVDEIVVVDTGSTDDTVAIAERFGAVVGQFEWCDDFAAARNASLALATGEWALWIDADEELAPGSERMIREALMRPQFGGYFLRIDNFMDEGEPADQYVHTAIRLFRRMPGIEFVSRVHEQVLPSIADLGFPTATLSGVRLRHYGYSAAQMAEKNKIDRTTRLLEREVADHPEDAFHWFNLANAYMVAGRPDDTARAARRSCDLIGEKMPYGTLAYHLLVSSLGDLGKRAEGLRAIDEADAKGYGGIMVEFERARILADAERNDEALRAIDHCLTLDWPSDLNGDYGIYTHKRMVLKGRILLQLGRGPEALDVLEAALRVHRTFPHTRYLRALALVAVGRKEEAVPELEALRTHPTYRGQVLRRLAALHGEAERWPEAATCLSELWQEGDLDDDAFVLWTVCSERLGSTEGVVEAYERYAARHEMTSDHLINWGRALARSGDSGRALACFSEAIKLDPNNPNALFNCGDLLYATGQYADAAHLFDTGLRQQPTHAPGWFVLGNCLYQLGVLEAAEIAYRQAVALQPEFAEAQSNLALVREERAA